MLVIREAAREFGSGFRRAPGLVRVVVSLMVACVVLLAYRVTVQLAFGLMVTASGSFMAGVTQVVFAVFPAFLAALVVRAALFLLQARMGSRVQAMVQLGFVALFGVLGGPLLMVPLALLALGLCFVRQVSSWSS